MREALEEKPQSSGAGSLARVSRFKVLSAAVQNSLWGTREPGKRAHQLEFTVKECVWILEKGPCEEGPHYFNTFRLSYGN